MHIFDKGTVPRHFVLVSFRRVEQRFFQPPIAFRCPPRKVVLIDFPMIPPYILSAPFIQILLLALLILLHRNRSFPQFPFQFTHPANMLCSRNWPSKLFAPFLISATSRFDRCLPSLTRIMHTLSRQPVNRLATTAPINRTYATMPMLHAIYLYSARPLISSAILLGSSPPERQTLPSPQFSCH